jgi:hypothetical protein
MGSLNVWTRSITAGSISIVASEQVLRVSILCRAGSTTVQGSAVYQGLASAQIALSSGQGLTIDAPSTNVPLDGITIEAAGAGDTVDILLSYQ